MENKHKVTDYFRLPVLQITALKERLKKADFNWGVKEQKTKESKYLFGMEIEVERTKAPDTALDFWNYTADNSLRNNGVEFITHPLRLEQFPAALIEINQYLDKTGNDFSTRTSVHIHMNVRDMVIEDIYKLILIYVVLEKTLFKWVGHGRETNPFCVPFYTTNYTQLLKKFLFNPEACVNRWEKYSALNLRTISQKGTIEFRHFYGTKDKETLLAWINILAAMKTCSKNISLLELREYIFSLNTTSSYQAFLEYVLGDAGKVLDKSHLQEEMEDAVIKIKIFSTIPPINDTIDPETLLGLRNQTNYWDRNQIALYREGEEVVFTFKNSLWGAIRLADGTPSFMYKGTL